MASLAERKPKAHRHLTRLLGTLTLTMLFAAGIVALMMLLAGVFRVKVNERPEIDIGLLSSATAAPVEGVVRMIRRPRRESAVGTIRAVYEAVVASKILARVEEVRVRAGQEVKQGDVLIVLDKADLKSRIEQSQAAETSARAKYEHAEIELSRAQRLKARESITQSELDQANTDFKTAKADLRGHNGQSKRPGSSRRMPQSAPRSRAESSTRRSMSGIPSLRDSLWSQCMTQVTCN